MQEIYVVTQQDVCVLKVAQAENPAASMAEHLIVVLLVQDSVQHYLLTVAELFVTFAQDYGGPVVTAATLTAADYLEKWNSVVASTCVLANLLNMFLLPLVYSPKKADT